MTEEQLRRLQGVFGSVNSALNTMSTMQLAESQLIAKQHELDKVEEINRVSQQNKDNYSLEKISSKIEEKRMKLK